jgi:hypothetical protein
VSNIDPSHEDQIVDIKAYRDAMDRAAAADKEKADLERKLQVQDVRFAVQTAGVPTGTGVGSAFINHLIDSGKPTDSPEAIHAEWIAWGGVKPEGSPAATPDQQAVEADREAMQLGGHNPDVTAQPPARRAGEVGLEQYFSRVKRGERKEDAFASVLDSVVGAAMSGDEDYIVKDYKG